MTPQHPAEGRPIHGFVGDDLGLKTLEVQYHPLLAYGGKSTSGIPWVPSSDYDKLARQLVHEREAFDALARELARRGKELERYRALHVLAVAYREAMFGGTVAAENRAAKALFEHLDSIGQPATAARADHSQAGVADPTTDRPEPRRVVTTLTQFPGGPVTVDAWIRTVRIAASGVQHVHWYPDGPDSDRRRYVGVAADVGGPGDAWDAWDAWEPHAWDTRGEYPDAAPWDQFDTLDTAAACLVALAQRADATKQAIVAAHGEAEQADGEVRS